MCFEIVPIESGSEDWKSWRRTKIGSSDAAAIMGHSPWETPLQCWYGKMEAKEKEITPAMKRGTQLEGVVRDKINEKYNAEYIPLCAQSLIWDFAIASLDGWDENADIAIIEIKCPGESTHRLALEGKIPLHYMDQLQHQMLVTGKKEALYVSYDGEESIAELIVKADQSYMVDMLLEERTFYERLFSFSPPEPTSKDRQDITDPIALAAALHFREVAEQIEHLELRKEKLRKELASYVTGNLAKIGDLSVTKVIRRGNVDYSLIPELKGVDVDQYRKPPVESWRIS